MSVPLWLEQVYLFPLFGLRFASIGITSSKAFALSSTQASGRLPHMAHDVVTGEVATERPVNDVVYRRPRPARPDTFTRVNAHTDLGACCSFGSWASQNIKTRSTGHWMNPADCWRKWMPCSA